MRIMFLKPCCSFNHQRGAAYLFVMLAVVVMSLGITAAAKQWKTVVQREKEADLLARGIEIQTAIGAYYSSKQKPTAQGPQNLSTVATGWYPLTLEELTKGPKPLLRKIYKDPMTGEDWEYVRDTGGRIKGVRSKSKFTAIKQHQFPPAVARFEGLTQYHDWVFQHALAVTLPNPQASSGKDKDGEKPASSTQEGQSAPGSTPTQPSTTPPAPAQ